MDAVSVLELFNRAPDFTFRASSVAPGAASGLAITLPAAGKYLVRLQMSNEAQEANNAQWQSNLVGDASIGSLQFSLPMPLDHVTYCVATLADVTAGHQAILLNQNAAGAGVRYFWQVDGWFLGR